MLTLGDLIFRHKPIEQKILILLALWWNAPVTQPGNADLRGVRAGREADTSRKPSGE